MATSTTSTAPVATIGLLWRGDRRPGAPPTRGDTLLAPAITAFAELNIAATPVVYSDDAVNEVRDELLALDGVLVWVNPIQDGADRTHLDELLREVAVDGVWVSAHPDTILAMGTKEVLVHTKGLGWGTDTHLYETPGDLRSEFPPRLAQDRVRVLKQRRGNGGQGVWKVAMIDDNPGATPPTVRVQQAVNRAGGDGEEMSLDAFMNRCDEYFTNAGRIIDQAFQARLADGLVRCYLVRDEVVGFCHQWPRGLLPAAAYATPPSSAPMEPASAPAYQALRTKMEGEWVPEMKSVLDLDTESLPAIWDADFLYGPKTQAGEDTYVLCEINVSAVWPFPDSATVALTKTAAGATITAKSDCSRIP